MKPHPKILDRILAELRSHQSFCVVGHIRPDGDCIGSQLALSLALLAQGKSVACWNEDVVPQKLRFLDPKGVFGRPVPGQEFDCVVALDCATQERLGKVLDCLGARKILLNIDHHSSNSRYGDVNWVSPHEPSTGEIVFRLLKTAGWPITPAIANCLFTAISTDTGSFQYPSTLPATYHAAAELVGHGADLSRICNEVYQSYPLSRVRLLRHVYNRFRLNHENRIAYLWLRKADFARTGAGKEDSEGLIDHIRDIEPVVVAILFEEMEPELTRVSLRSKDPRVNVSEIAALFGGGGHPAAAGARIPGRPLSVQRRLVAAVRRAIDAAGKT